jgi:Lipopolysaccharide kinase (Kdo/WaaP) family
MTRDYTADGWAAILSDNGLDTFQAIWDACDEWVEEPNYHPRRGGSNGVARKVLRTPDGGDMEVYIKVHTNLTRRTLRHPIRGEPALARELRSNLRCVELGVRCAAPLHYVERRIDGESRAIFINQGLTDYEALDEVAKRWDLEGWPSPEVRHRLVGAVAAEFRKIHEGGLVAIYLVPKHIFVRVGDGPGGIDPDTVAVIDLERMRVADNPADARRRDFKKLSGDAPGWSRTDRVRFLRAYDRSEKLTPEAKALWREIQRRSQD